MKRPTLGILAVLVCMVTMSTVLAQCPDGLNCIEIFDPGEDGPGAVTIGATGGATASTTKWEDLQWSNGNTVATVKSGLWAQVKLPEGVQGEVYSFQPTDGYMAAVPIVNGQKYDLIAYHEGLINLGALKDSPNGVASSEAKIYAEAKADNAVTDPEVCPDCKNNLLSGYAEVSAKTTNTGFGATYAINEGEAGYLAFPDQCEDCEAKNVEGEVYADIELETCNQECVDCCQDCEEITSYGSSSADAKVYTKSSANAYKSDSFSSAALNTAASRTSKGSAQAQGAILGIYAASEGTDNTVFCPMAYNSETEIIGSGAMYSASNAYAAKDTASSAASISSEAATNNQASVQTNLADNKVNVKTTAVRSSTLDKVNLVNSYANLENMVAYATSADTRTGSKYATADIAPIDVTASDKLLKVGTISTTFALEEKATRTKTATTAWISKSLTNIGPISGSASDEAYFSEDADDLNAAAKSTSSSKNVHIDDEVITSDIFGNHVGNAQGSSSGSVTGASVSQTTTPSRSTWKLTFKATA